MCTENILSFEYRKDIKTITLMDQFEVRDENQNHRYTALVLKNIFQVLFRGKMYQVDLMIKRKPYEMAWYGCGITFTFLKKMIAYKTFSSDCSENPKLISCVIRALSSCDTVTDNEELLLDEPLIFLAQNSGNRTGYGSSYHAGRLAYAGTKFGETTPYIITRVRLINLNFEDII